MAFPRVGGVAEQLLLAAWFVVSFPCTVHADVDLVDLSPVRDCKSWAAQGECSENPSFMMAQCAASCSFQLACEESVGTISSLRKQVVELSGGCGVATAALQTRVEVCESKLAVASEATLIPTNESSGTAATMLDRITDLDAKLAKTLTALEIATARVAELDQQLLDAHKNAQTERIRDLERIHELESQLAETQATVKRPAPLNGSVERQEDASIACAAATSDKNTSALKARIELLETQLLVQSAPSDESDEWSELYELLIYFPGNFSRYANLTKESAISCGTSIRILLHDVASSFAIELKQAAIEQALHASSFASELKQAAMEQALHAKQLALEYILHCQRSAERIVNSVVVDATVVAGRIGTRATAFKARIRWLLQEPYVQIPIAHLFILVALASFRLAAFRLAAAQLRISCVSEIYNAVEACGVGSKRDREALTEVTEILLCTPQAGGVPVFDMAVDDCSDRPTPTRIARAIRGALVLCVLCITPMALHSDLAEPQVLGLMQDLLERLSEPHVYRQQSLNNGTVRSPSYNFHSLSEL